MGLPLISLENPEGLGHQSREQQLQRRAPQWGIRPLSSGMPLSCMGTAARSEMSSVTTSQLDRLQLPRAAVAP